jgi:hypothetical protein
LLLLLAAAGPRLSMPGCCKPLLLLLPLLLAAVALVGSGSSRSSACICATPRIANVHVSEDVQQEPHANKPSSRQGSTF